MSTVRKRPLIVFGEDWDKHPSSTQHLVRRLAADRKVIWANSIGLRRPRFDRHDLTRLTRKLGAMVRRQGGGGSTDETVPVRVVSPKAVCWPGSRLASAVNSVLLPRSLRNAVAELDEAPILWCSLPTAVDAVGRLGESAVVYYVGDDFAALAGVDHAPVAEMERELAEQADLILAASPVIAERFPSEKTHILPHGCDVDLFSRPTERAMDMPVDTPVAGFYGSISDWIDVELLADVSEQMPHWRFDLIGAVNTDIAPLTNRSNVRFLGPRPHGELPCYSQYWDVSMLPFRDTPQIRACNPLKLREYLAAGKPVVTTDFPALDGYRDLVRVVEGPDSFVAALQALRFEPVDRIAERRARVRNESWDVRAAELDQLLEDLCPSRRKIVAAG